ncbi:DUF2381 family protein [Archangium violaceum]|uniref:DUF2381 family protein n=1 Tax=Archangium violaceum Cb vi76 TaxID=1406225 RepID=A0A084SMN0_9BACT|nr:DUF2381 family protein [Archangium violaceum]KFA89715.1 hypothetical protein Q664_33045 [Archangium violaceum Cb vi76]
MLSSPLWSLLALLPFQGAVVEQPPLARCEDVQRIELALEPSAAAREICVSPGLTTSLHFDAPVSVDLQDEVHFEAVVRDRKLLTVMPPPEMSAGERLRLTVRFEGEPASSGTTLMLVGRSGQATHQVEVSRDERTRESLRRELLQERARTAQLREALARTQAMLEQSGGLRSLIASKTMGPSGVQAQAILLELPGQPEGGLSWVSGISYRANKTVAAEVWLLNSGPEPWRVAGGSLVDARGVEMKGLKFRQDEDIAPGQLKPVIVEVDASYAQARGELTLTLWDERGRTITLPKVTFP